MMFEKQCKSSGADLVKGASSTSENPSKESTDAAQDSSAKDNNLVIEAENKKETEGEAANLARASGETSKLTGEKQKAVEAGVLENPEASAGQESDSPPAKRAKVDE